MKLDKISQWRLEGMGYAFRMIKEHGLDEFEKELQYRKKTGISAFVTQKELKEVRDIVTQDALKVAMVFAVYALHDEFNFGRDRCDRFVKRYETKAKHFTEELFTWDEMAEMLKQETGIEVNFT